MAEYKIKAVIKSDAIFGSGKSKGQIHEDCQYDEDGFVYYGGKTLKGMLRKTGKMIIDNYLKIDNENGKKLEETLIKLFGSEYVKDRAEGILRFEDLKVSEELRNKVKSKSNAQPDEVLNAMTDINSFIKIDSTKGVTEEKTLRNIRTIKKEMVFYSKLGEINLSDDEEKLLDLIVKNTNYLGMNISKGRGEVELKLYKNEEITKKVNAEEVIK